MDRSQSLLHQMKKSVVELIILTWKKFGAQFAYTLDGDTEGEIQYENFNACKADFELQDLLCIPVPARIR